jgi:two-component system sensor histidine kinase HydH
VPGPSEFPGGASRRRIKLVALGRLLILGGSQLLVFSSLYQRDGPLSAAAKLSLLALLLSVLLPLLQILVSVRRFYATEVAMGQLLVDQLLISVLVFLSGGVASGATSLYGLSCLAGGLMLGVPGAIAAALAGGVCFSLTALLEQSHALPLPGLLPPLQQGLAGDQATFYIVVNVLVLALVALLVSYLIERVARASGELVEARQRAAAAERMAAMGRLAAGLAHEIRNPLSSISGSVQILRTGLEHAEDRQLCDIVLRESARLEELVSDMVDLSRQRRPQPEDVDVGAVVSDVIELMRRSGRALSDVRIRQTGERTTRVRADPGQLRQLVWNLVRNAVQASSAGGEVRVDLRVARVVTFIVDDDGVGIGQEALSQLFDAFFTTRSQGTGIGLAVVKRIADEHGFTVRVESGSGQGARFEVDLGVPL